MDSLRCAGQLVSLLNLVDVVEACEFLQTNKDNHAVPCAYNVRRLQKATEVTMMCVQWLRDTSSVFQGH